MRTIITDEDYRELLRTQKANEFKLVALIMLGTTIFIAIEGAIIGWTTTDDFMSVFVWFYIPIGIMLLVTLIFYLLMKRTLINPFDSKVYYNYVNYQTEGTKIPLYRVINYGKSSETVTMILDIDRDEFKFYDVRKKKIKLYLSCRTDELIFHFFYKNKQGIDVLKKKLHLEINGSKKKIYVLREIGERFIPYLKSEGYNYQEN